MPKKMDTYQDRFIMTLEHISDLEGMMKDIKAGKIPELSKEAVMESARRLHEKHPNTKWIQYDPKTSNGYVYDDSSKTFRPIEASDNFRYCITSAFSGIDPITPNPLA